MTTTRITINNKLLKELKTQYENKIYNEFKIIPSASVLVTIGILELKAMKNNINLEIKFNKNGKIKYKFKQKE